MLNRSEHAWILVLGSGLLLTAINLALPYGMVAAASYVATAVLAALATGFAANASPRPFRPTAWHLFSLGIALDACGHALWYWLDFQGMAPTPSIADLFYFASYLPFGAALCMLARRDESRDGSLIDALIISVSAATLGWALLIAPYIYSTEMPLTELVVSAMYPIADLLMVTLALRLVFLHRTRVLAHGGLLLAMCAYGMADVLYAYGGSEGWYLPGGVTDAFWPIAYSLIAAAAWHPSTVTEPQAHTSPGELSTRRLILLAIATVLVPALLLVIDHHRVALVRPVAFASIVLFILVMYRLAGLMHQTHQQAAVLEQLSLTDPLTGTLNRRGLDHEFKRELARAERTGTPLQLIFLDLDHFKRYNDTHGHEAGDDLLEIMTRQWRQILRPADALARFGGEEFVALLPDTDAEAAHGVAERLRRSMPHGQTCSAGIAQFNAGEGLESLLKRADAALYAAKDAGRDRIVVARSITERANEAGTAAPACEIRDQYQ